MNNITVFKNGVILGFGLLIPLAIGMFGYSFFSYQIYSSFDSDVQESLNYDSSLESYKNKEEENIKTIEIQSYKDVKDGDFVMILGSIKNISDKKMGSITVEAEFFNSNGDFVYEESEYIAQRLSPNQVENFSIKCGCNNRKFPEYSRVEVRVVSASDY